MNNNKYIGKTLSIKIDRQKGSSHPKYPDFIYPINYGYVPNTKSSDGEEIDCYLLGVDEAVNEYTGVCIGIVRRTDDDDDKLIIVPAGVNYTDEEIEDMVSFQEKYFHHIIIR